MSIFDRVDTTEIRKLSELLSHNGVAHEFIEEPEMGGATIKVPDLVEWRRTGIGVSVIQHRGSYGGPEGKLEMWITPEMKAPNGWMSAEEVFAAIMKRCNHDAP